MISNAFNVLFYYQQKVYQDMVKVRRATRVGHLCSPEIFKKLHSNFDIRRSFQRLKMKFYIPIIFKKSYWNFSLSSSLIMISLQDLS